MYKKNQIHLSWRIEYTWYWEIVFQTIYNIWNTDDILVDQMLLNHYIQQIKKDTISLFSQWVKDF